MSCDLNEISGGWCCYLADYGFIMLILLISEHSPLENFRLSTLFLGRLLAQAVRARMALRLTAVPPRRELGISAILSTCATNALSRSVEAFPTISTS